jgi:hypothetical protein
VERGRFGINAERLAEIARVLQKPVSWFYPPDLALAQDALDQQVKNIAYELQRPHGLSHKAEPVPFTNSSSTLSWLKRVPSCTGNAEKPH